MQVACYIVVVAVQAYVYRQERQCSTAQQAAGMPTAKHKGRQAHTTNNTHTGMWQAEQRDRGLHTGAYCLNVFSNPTDER